MQTLVKVGCTVLDDTIVAIATAMGEASIGIIRISGPAAVAIGKKIFIPHKNKNWYIGDNYKLVYGLVTEPESEEVLDEVLLSLMRGPHSFTAEDVVEISCHGGIIPLRRTLAAVLRAGARLAEPGEFSKRAFLNGRLDLAQAESIIDLIRAKTDNGAKVAMGQLGGKLSQIISMLQDKLTEVLAQIEANIDFPEDDIDDASWAQIESKCRLVKGEVDSLLTGANAGKIYREGLKTVIVGKPNVGKSSLLNALLGESRAIVTDIPGTTRDVIEEAVNIRGIALNIIDTAGLRETKDLVEKIGVERSRELLQQADLILLVLDANIGLSAEDQVIMQSVSSKNTIVLLNKIDLAHADMDQSQIKTLMGPVPVVEISAKEEIGLEKLADEIVRLVLGGQVLPAESIMVANIRHIRVLEQVRNYLEEVLIGISSNVPADLIAIDLKGAWEALGQITGTTLTDDLVDRIFADFCIGK